MEHLDSGAGLAALGFWIFIAAIVVSGVWYDIRKRDAQHETLRRVIESGQPIDESLTDKLLAVTAGSKELDRDLKVGGLITLFVAPGLAVFGWGMSLVEARLLVIMLSVSGLVGFVAIGLLVASWVVRRWYGDGSDTDATLPGA